MSNFFEIFNPGQRYTREQSDIEKLLVVQDAQGGSGPDPLDLDSGSVVLRMPPQPPAPEPDEGSEASSGSAIVAGTEPDPTLPEPDPPLPEPDPHAP